MLKFILVVLAFSAATADLGLNAGTTTISRSTASCLRTQNVSRVAVEILNDRGTFNTNYINTFIYLLDANISNVDAIVRISDKFDPEGTCNNITRALPQAFNGTVWLAVETASSWSVEVGRRIDFLEEFSLNCRAHGFKVGIFSKVTSWTLIMGSPTAGSDKLRTLPVWYFNDNGVDDFNDFRYAGFGKWPSATMKEYRTSPYLCSNTFAGYEYYQR